MQCTLATWSRRTSYWCIIGTLEAAGFHVRPYHAAVPSFGEWGYVLAAVGPIPERLALSPDLKGQLRFLNDDILNSLFELPPDLKRIDADINQLNSQALVRYYDQEWGSWK